MHDLAAIRAFNALCEYKSLTAAARELDQPKSTLSRRLAQLEEDLGQALVARDGNRLTLTKAGEIFHSYSEQLIDIAAKSQEALQELDHQVSGELVIAVDPNLMRGWMAKVIDSFMLDHPNIRFRVHSQYNPSNSQLTPDLIVWIGLNHAEGYHCAQLGRWRYGVYASPSYLLEHGPINHPSQLNEHDWIDFISFRQGGLKLSHHEEGNYVLPSFESRLQNDHLAMQADTIKKGLGIGLLPTAFANGFIRSHPGSLINCLSGWYSDPVKINYYYPLGRPPLRLRLFIESMLKQRPENWL
ncbi:LysR family transcriptional regulator [Vibrio tritonius]|uniref:LysR family transcriptional regulator n=1 Tax=Vibrio tritonius TaxID=1435069 RepID=UPI00315D84B8